MNAIDIMTRKPVTVRSDLPILAAIRIMLGRGISGLPVVDEEGDLVGMITEGDLLRRVEMGTERRRPDWLAFFTGTDRLAREYVQSHSRNVADVMTRDVISVSEDAPLEEIVELMIGRRIKRVPVLRGTKLVGIVTRANLLRLLADLLDVRAENGNDDKAIRERIFAELGEQLWARVEGMRIDVKDGDATLGGVITDEWVRDALRVAVENVPGVKAVKDDMVLLEPFTGTVLDPILERRL
ncbi:CBS domain-containing protein [Inquilinus limosus]|uniref:CBS domain-containing protein n=1 Tax=Inquilinus limosus TaxID=171674 RepID=UPI0004162EBE|nr:CBS domain-containing protein [Inquilinus limosus]